MKAKKLFPSSMHILACCILATGLTGCSWLGFGSSSSTTTSVSTTRSMQLDPQDEPNSDEVELVAEPQVSNVNTNPPSSVETGKTVYFEFDSDAVLSPFQPVIESQAMLLKADPSRSVHLEGHTDSRGSREYNLALGQRRAESVARSLTQMGVRAQQIDSVSFGEEQPVDTGTSEEAYAKNRRVEFGMR